jgi:hypothetical protein
LPGKELGIGSIICYYGSTGYQYQIKDHLVSTGYHFLY